MVMRNQSIIKKCFTEKFMNDNYNTIMNTSLFDPFIYEVDDELFESYYPGTEMCILESVAIVDSKEHSSDYHNNLTWGCGNIRDKLSNIGYALMPEVSNMLKDHNNKEEGSIINNTAAFMDAMTNSISNLYQSFIDYIKNEMLDKESRDNISTINIYNLYNNIAIKNEFKDKDLFMQPFYTAHFDITGQYHIPRKFDTDEERFMKYISNNELSLDVLVFPYQSKIAVCELEYDTISKYKINYNRDDFYEYKDYKLTVRPYTSNMYDIAQVELFAIVLDIALERFSKSEKCLEFFNIKNDNKLPVELMNTLRNCIMAKAVLSEFTLGNLTFMKLFEIIFKDNTKKVLLTHNDYSRWLSTASTIGERTFIDRTQYYDKLQELYDEDGTLLEQELKDIEMKLKNSPNDQVLLARKKTINDIFTFELYTDSCLKFLDDVSNHIDINTMNIEDFFNEINKIFKTDYHVDFMMKIL